jgi:hypothetical protein
MTAVRNHAPSISRIALPLLVLAWSVQLGLAAGPSLASSPPSGTVTVGSPLSWDFAPVGGLTGANDTFKLTVQLPDSTSTLYARDVRTGSAYAAVLKIVLTWTGLAPDDTLGLSATDPNGKSVGDDTLATTNSGGNINVFAIQMPLNETYTIEPSGRTPWRRCTSSTSRPSHSRRTRPARPASASPTSR